MHTYIILTSNTESSLSALSAFGAELIASKENEFIVWLWRDATDTSLATIQKSGDYIGNIQIS